MSPFARVSSTSSDASASVVDNGLSQMTSIPASRNALATGEVQMVRGDDDDGLYAVGTRGLAGRHFAIIRVTPVGRKPEIGARSARVFGVRG